MRLSAVLFVSLLWLSAVNSVWAQGEANMWYFGGKHALDFNSGAPVPVLNSAMDAHACAASISDANGNLLFYTNSETIWDSSHQVMQNGAGLLGSISYVQSTIIIPKPGNPNVYFVFHSAPLGPPSWIYDELYYSEVDMTLNGGLGGVTSNKNILLSDKTFPFLTATKHANGIDFWLITYGFDNGLTNVYRSFLISASGVSTAPVTSVNGSWPQNGIIKVCPKGNKVALSGGMTQYPSTASMLVMDFDDQYGTLFNPEVYPLVNTGGGGGIGGIEFSPCGDLLYYAALDTVTSGGPQASGLFQMDLSLGSPTAIANSITLISNPSYSFLLQLGPDRKIYASTLVQSLDTLSVIQNADSIGLACNYAPHSLHLGAPTSWGGVGSPPNFISSYFECPHIFVEDTCKGDSTKFTLHASLEADSAVWNFGDTASGANNAATGDPVYHVFSDTGSYEVSVIRYFTGFNGTASYLDSAFDTVTVTIHPAPIISLGNDTTICDGDSLTVMSSNTMLSMTYLWSDSSTLEFLPITEAGTYYVAVSTVCGVDYDTIVVDSLLPSTVDLGPDTIRCIGDTVTWDVPFAGGSYLWHDNTTDSVYHATTTGWYSVTATGMCGTAHDSAHLTFMAPPSSNMPADTAFCIGGSAEFIVQGDSMMGYLWSTGSIDTSITVSTTDTFWVQAWNGCDTLFDSSMVFVDEPLTINLMDDTVACVGNSVVLDPDVPGNNAYLWKNGSTADTLRVNAPGAFWVEITNTCGTYYDTTVVFYERPPDIALPDEEVICVGDTLRKDVTFSRSSYAWNTGDTSAQVAFHSAGLYIVTVTNLCGTKVDSVSLRLDYPLDIDLGADYNLCKGETLSLDATAPDNPQYRWNTGSDSAQIVLSEEGLYRVTVTNACGDFISQTAVYVWTEPKISIPSDTVLCGDVTWTIEAETVYPFYEWHDGSSQPSFTVTSDGTYSVFINNSCGSIRDTVHVTYRDLPSVDLGPDTIVCKSIAPVILNAFSGSAYTYEWQDGSTNYRMVAAESGRYAVTVRDSAGCAAQDEVYLGDCPIIVWVPNSFSPNGDGLNEVFLPKVRNVNDYLLRIYDRWGHLVFTANEPEQGWDGKLRGKPVQVGVYSYMLVLYSDEVGEQKLTGKVTLLE